MADKKTEQKIENKLTGKARYYYMSAKGEKGSGRVSFWVEQLKKLKSQDGKVYEDMGGYQVIAKHLLGASAQEYVRSAGPMEVMFTPNDNSMHVSSYFFPFDLESLERSFSPLSKADKEHAQSLFILKLATPITRDDGTWEINTPSGADEPLVQTNMKGVYFKEVDLVDGKAPKIKWFEYNLQTYNPDDFAPPEDLQSAPVFESVKVALGKRK